MPRRASAGSIPSDRYWLDRRLALHAPFLQAARLIAEPCYFDGTRLGSWRATGLLDSIDCRGVSEATGIAAAFIAPVHLPRAIVGAVIWASRKTLPMADVFAQHAPRLHALALQCIAAHAEASRRLAGSNATAALTRREVQCLRWAAGGKTDAEIAIILGLSVSTIRFHLRNAGAKMGTTGRAQAVQVAAGLGFVSPLRGARS